MTLLTLAPPMQVGPAPAARPLVRPIVRAIVRPIEPTDGPALVALGRRCSPESLLHRFMSPVTGIPESHVADLVVARRGMDSVVAVTDDGDIDGDIIGVATAAPAQRGPTELAVLVEDHWQRQGIGRTLVRHLVRRARRQGTTQLAVVVSSTRPGLIRALAPLGPSQHFLDGPTLEALYDIA